MQFKKFNEETVKIWKKASSELAADRLPIELELYKKLLNFFQVGDYFYFVFNFNNYQFDLISAGVKKMLGYDPAEITTELFMDRIHPDDRPWFLAFEKQTAEFLSGLPIDKLMKYKVRYDFRMRRKDGIYIRILHQVAIVEHDEKGGIIRTLGVHTDITHLKPDGKPVMSYIGMDDEPSYENIDATGTFPEGKQTLTYREKQILAYLIEGKLSKEISDLLNISKQTVDTHRKNMLRKNSLNNSGELIAKAIKLGWV